MPGKSPTGPPDPSEAARQLLAKLSADSTQNPHELLSLLGGIDPRIPVPERPELRRAPREECATYRIRIDLDDATPPVWRRLDVRSDLPLSAVHQIVQAAYGWQDYHLHRFSIGGHPFDLHSQVFLCPFEVEEADPIDGGIAATGVRLDETMSEPGDVLRYAYDYGDSWELTLKLEEVLPADAEPPAAVCVGGRRAAPPEDSRGYWEEGRIEGFDPAAFDVGEVNTALRSPYVDLSIAAIDPSLGQLLSMIVETDLGQRLAHNLPTALAEPDEEPTGETLAALHAVQWFLDRAEPDGIPLTSAGYLKPADVVAASAVVPAAGGWIGAKNRESHCPPLLDFRESLQAVGLLRKRKGQLLLTRAGKAAQQDPLTLWRHLVDRLGQADPSDFQATSGQLVLAYAAVSPGTKFPLDELADALTDLGWRTADGTSVPAVAVGLLPTLSLLVNFTVEQRTRWHQAMVTPAASALAQAALRRP